MIAVGVLYGYGSKEELVDAGAHQVCATPQRLLANEGLAVWGREKQSSRTRDEVRHVGGPNADSPRRCTHIHSFLGASLQVGGFLSPREICPLTSAGPFASAEPRVATLLVNFYNFPPFSTT